MERISAAENLLIETSPSIWRLLAYDENGEAKETVKAVANAPLIYNASFANTRHLPANGALPTKYICQVVLGWSHQDEAWHLGLLLSQNIADVRGSRWCELVNWPEPDSNVFEGLAYQAGEALANVLQIPFNFIPPRPESIRRPSQQPQSMTLPDLPINVGTWELTSSDNKLELIRTRAWRWSKYRQIAWYVILMVIYAVLSIATIQADLALPNAGTMLPSPEYLPYLGLGIVGILFLMTLYQLYELLFQPNRIEVQPGSIRAFHNHTPRWHKTSDELQAVYVTHVIEHKRRRFIIKHGEINLLSRQGKFKRLLEQAEREDELAPNPDTAVQEFVAELNTASPLTPLQGIALHLAHTLGDLTCIYDQRTK
ncbi:MAG: hypothetical protein D6711_17780 [Chloroflexi bacterium]|nr:MAG: hypothetical protein D6711_17780 [Chloroflexota bacterium]